MISSIIGSRIDYCNSLLIAISEQNLDRLQGVQSKSKAARIVCNAIIYIYEIGEIVFQTMPVVNILTTTDTSFGLRRFSVAGPRIWNGLPHELYDSATHTSVFQVSLEDILPPSHGQYKIHSQVAPPIAF